MIGRQLVETIDSLPSSTPMKLAAGTLSESAKLRNAALDWLFYDVNALSPEEMHLLVSETNTEGAILVVHPKGTKGPLSITKLDSYEALVDSPGRKLKKFAVAGVGSSDVGAAALARNLADHTGEPVGAIVAGYGVADLLSEALGGFFFFGAANAMVQRWHDVTASQKERTDAMKQTLTAMERGSLSPEELTISSDIATGFSPDTMTLLRLLTEKDRRIDTVVGHSKGCLSIVFALEALALLKDHAAIDHARAAKFVTLGAVVEFPRGYENVKQVIGAIDWFGGMNSRLGKDAIKVPGAWHHLNRALPYHLNARDVFASQL